MILPGWLVGRSRAPVCVCVCVHDRVFKSHLHFLWDLGKLCLRILRYASTYKVGELMKSKGDHVFIGLRWTETRILVGQLLKGANKLVINK